MPTAAVAPKFGRVAMIGKPSSAGIAASLRELRAFLEKRGCKVLDEGDAASADLAIVVGGDGTMLAAARDLVRHRVPLVGINQGRVGFMTDIGQKDMLSGVGAILGGEGSVEDRSLLDAEILRGGRSILRTLALNEAVLGKGAQGRLIEFSLSLDGEFVYTLRADGMIVATPTGSTAYSLSARGPIVSPTHRALLLTPVAPHMLFDRTLVLEATETVRLEVLGPTEATLSVDGRPMGVLRAGQSVVCGAGPHSARLVTFGGRDFHQILKAKFGLADR